MNAHGKQSDGTPWRIAVKHPDDSQPTLQIIDLQDESLSVSGSSGKSFLDDEGNEQGHVIDPRTGRPTQAAHTAAVICDSAAESDAWATALLVDPALTPPSHIRVCDQIDS